MASAFLETAELDFQQKALWILRERGVQGAVALYNDCGMHGRAYWGAVCGFSVWMTMFFQRHG